MCWINAWILGNVVLLGMGRPFASKLPCQPESMLMYRNPCGCSPEAASASDSAATFAWVRKLELMVCSLKVLQPRYGRCPTSFTCAGVAGENARRPATRAVASHEWAWRLPVENIGLWVAGSWILQLRGVRGIMAGFSSLFKSYRNGGNVHGFVANKKQRHSKTARIPLSRRGRNSAKRLVIAYRLDFGE